MSKTKAATELFNRFLLFARKKLAKTNKEGIMKIPNDEQAKALANETIAKFTTYKVPPSALNTTNDIAMIDNQINSIEQNKLVNQIKKNLTPKKDNVIDITDKMPNPFENLEAAKKAGNFKGIANQVLRDPDIAREFMLSKKFPTTVASGEDAIPIARRAKFDEEVPYKPLPDEEYTVEKIVKDFKKVGATDKDIQTILTSGKAGQIPYVMSNYGLSFKDVISTLKSGKPLIEGLASGGRAGLANGSPIDPKVAKGINEALISEAIKKQPEGVLMDPPPEPNYNLIEAMTTPKDKGLLPNNIIEFDDGTIFFKDSGEYYKKDGTQVDGPSKGAKIKPKILEAAEGGRIGFFGGGAGKYQMDLPFGKPLFTMVMNNKLYGIYQNKDGSRLSVPLGSDGKPNYATGGRAGFDEGGMSRRKFMKIMGGLATLPFVGKFFKGAKTAAPIAEKAAETVTQAPSYFFDLVSKIKIFGKQRQTPSYKERVNEFSYTGKDGIEYELIEDLDTGEIKITKDKLGGRSFEEGSYEVIEDRTEMVFKKGQADETTKGKKPPDEYEEYKVEFDQDGTAADASEIDELSKSEIIKEVLGNAPSIKKASGGIARMLGE